MQVLIVTIEKDGDTYIGRSPNLLRVSITAKTFEEAQTAILDAMDKRITELSERHNNRPPISRRPIEETIECVFKYPDGEECWRAARKDGLCSSHWKKLYGHPYGTTLKSCPLCGESDVNKLGDYYSPCLFKIENSDWENILEEIKLKQGGKLAEERRQVRLEKLGKNLQCRKIQTNGIQCLRAAYFDGLCRRHLSAKREAEDKERERLILQHETPLTYFSRSRAKK